MSTFYIMKNFRASLLPSSYFSLEVKLSSLLSPLSAGIEEGEWKLIITIHLQTANGVALGGTPAEQ